MEIEGQVVGKPCVDGFVVGDVDVEVGRGMLDEVLER